jgi:hypothetical protein
MLFTDTYKMRDRNAQSRGGLFFWKNIAAPFCQQVLTIASQQFQKIYKRNKCQRIVSS